MDDDVGNNERGDRDLLDWMYLLSRVVLLFSIVYFYSSITRFLVVAVIAGLVYLYQVKIIPIYRENSNIFSYRMVHLELEEDRESEIDKGEKRREKGSGNK